MNDQSSIMDSQTAFWILNTIDSKPAAFSSPYDMCQRVNTVESLPTFPKIGHLILELKSDPNADAKKLAKIIETSPDLAAQIIRWANSALYGFRGKILSVQDAVTRVLGFDNTLNIALSASILQPLSVPKEGPLGSRMFWRHSLAGSLLIQKIVSKITFDQNITPSELSLAFLLHNIGHLLFCHLFRNEYDFLTKLLQSNSNTPIIDLERFAFGIDHTQIGCWLMKSWKMPNLIQTAVQHHHNSAYRGQHESIVWLICLTNRLLGQLGIGDECNSRSDGTDLYCLLDLKKETASLLLADISESLASIDDTVAQLI